VFYSLKLTALKISFFPQEGTVEGTYIQRKLESCKE